MVAAERIFRRCGAPQFSTSNFMVFRGGPNGEEVCPLNQKSRTVKYFSHTFTYVQLSCRLRRYTPIIFLARRVTSIVLFPYLSTIRRWTRIFSMELPCQSIVFQCLFFSFLSFLVGWLFFWQVNTRACSASQTLRN